MERIQIKELRQEFLNLLLVRKSILINFIGNNSWTLAALWACDAEVPGRLWQRSPSSCLFHYYMLSLLCCWPIMQLLSLFLSAVKTAEKLIHPVKTSVEHKAYPDQSSPAEKCHQWGLQALGNRKENVYFQLNINTSLLCQHAKNIHCKP